MKRLSIVLVLVLSLAACSKKSPHNEADIAFAQAMIPLQHQTIQLADIGLEHAHTPDVKQVARRIKIKTEEELKATEKFLQEWHVEPGPGHEQAGKLPEAEVKELEEAKGTKFDRLFLTKMIEHHEKVLPIVEKEEHEGKFKEATKLAHETAKTAEREIEEMKHLRVVT